MFERSVFINCPFDDDYAPLLQAIAFCATFLGFWPRLAPQNGDNALNRLNRIDEIIRTSKYGIHDLSRNKAKTKGEFSRMNMPFELGIDYGCKTFGAAPLATKCILVLEERRYDYQKCLSDIAGWDIEAHGGDNRWQFAKYADGWCDRPARRRRAPLSLRVDTSFSSSGIGRGNLLQARPKMTSVSIRPLTSWMPCNSGWNSANRTDCFVVVDSDDKT